MAATHLKKKLEQGQQKNKQKKPGKVSGSKRKQLEKHTLKM